MISSRTTLDFQLIWYLRYSKLKFQTFQYLLRQFYFKDYWNKMGLISKIFECSYNFKTQIDKWNTIVIYIKTFSISMKKNLLWEIKSFISFHHKTWNSKYKLKKESLIIIFNIREYIIVSDKSLFNCLVKNINFTMKLFFLDWQLDNNQ